MSPQRLRVLLLFLTFACNTATSVSDGGGGARGGLPDSGPLPDGAAGSGGGGGALAPDAGPDGAAGAPVMDARRDFPPVEAGPSCEAGLTASSTLVQPGCDTALKPEGIMMIPDGTYRLVSISRTFGCLPERFSPPASGTIRVTGTDIAAVEGAMGPNGVTFTAWTGFLVYFGGSDVRVEPICGRSDRFGDQILVDPAMSRVTFFRVKNSSLEGWTYQKM